MTPSIPENIATVRQHLALFEHKYARLPGSVQLLAVSKTHGVDKIRSAAECGQKSFAENYLQEALEKIAETNTLALDWHFIGPIQSNKTSAIAENFNWVHTIDRLKIAKRLNAQRPEQLPPLNILLQVNISEESSKAGLSLAELPEFAKAVGLLPQLKLKGLMAIPAPETDFAEQRAVFRKLAQARDSLLAAGFEDCQQLSIGMSQDYEAAIAEGATMIRIGTGLFGPRLPGSAKK